MTVIWAGDSAPVPRGMVTMDVAISAAFDANNHPVFLNLPVLFRKITISWYSSYKNMTCSFLVFLGELAQTFDF